VEASALTKAQLSGLRGPSPLLRLAPDERLIALVRRGQSAAFETIVSRYQARLLAFCRHLLASREDAEDVLQEVFAAAYNAMLADRREINLRPWLYRIARNRCLNHLRRQTSIGVDSMDVHFADGGASTVEKAAGREDFRLLMSDIRRLPETQRTALLLREMDALSYDQIAEAMETTVPGVKSLLVRARISLGEAAEARKLTCAEVRLELGAIAEGISTASPAVRRHVKDCDRCRAFRAHLRANNRAMAAMLPVGPFLLLKKFALAKLGLTVGAGGASATAGSGGAGATATAGAVGAAGTAGVGATGAVGAVGAAGAAGVSGGTAGAITAGALATKAVAGLAAAALVTAGAVEVHQAPRRTRPSRPAVAQRHIAAASVPVQIPRVIVSAAQPTTTEVPAPSVSQIAAEKAQATPATTSTPTIAIAPPVQLTPVVAEPTIPTATQQVSNVSVLPPQPGTPATPIGTGTPPGTAATPPNGTGSLAAGTPTTTQAGAPAGTPTTTQAGAPAVSTTTGEAGAGQPTGPSQTSTVPSPPSDPSAGQPVNPSNQPIVGSPRSPGSANPPAGSPQATSPAIPTGPPATGGATAGTNAAATSSPTTMTEILGGAVVKTPAAHSGRRAHTSLSRSSPSDARLKSGPATRTHR
jgi:RNA polymerase sigma factor (sigma-70 family)